MREHLVFLLNVLEGLKVAVYRLLGSLVGLQLECRPLAVTKSKLLDGLAQAGLGNTSQTVVSLLAVQLDALVNSRQPLGVLAQGVESLAGVAAQQGC